MKNWVDYLIKFIGILLILLAIGLFLKPYIDGYILHKKDNKKIENYNNKDNHSNKSSTVPKDKSKMLGYIFIPDAKIKTPVYPGPATPQQLNRGVSLAEEKESLDDQNIAIAGHKNTIRDNYQFTNLPKAKKGSTVYFKVANKRKKYKVTKIFDVKPDETSVLDEQSKSKNQLTLITCDNYNEETSEWENRTIFIAEEV